MALIGVRFASILTKSERKIHIPKSDSGLNALAHLTLKKIYSIISLVIKMLTLLKLEEIKAIYNKYMVKDFPPDELKPLSSILDMLRRNIYACYGLFEGEILLAYAYLTVLDDFVLVDYLAVVPENRGNGIGTKLLSELKGILKDKTVIIECENPDFATNTQDKTTKLRRIEFYKRSGFTLSGITSRLFDVEYVILSYPECENIALGLEKLYTNMLGEKLCSKKLIVKT